MKPLMPQEVGAAHRRTLALRAMTVAAVLFFGWGRAAAAEAPENGTGEAGLSLYGAMGRGGWIFASAEAAVFARWRRC